MDDLTAQTAVGIMDSLAAISIYSDWTRRHADATSGRQGLYVTIVETAQQVERVVAAKGLGWGEDIDFYLTCDAVAVALVIKADNGDGIGLADDEIPVATLVVKAGS